MKKKYASGVLLSAALLMMPVTGFASQEGMFEFLPAAAIEAMHGMDVLADLVAQDLDGEARLVTIEDGSMDEQSGWFVYGDQMFVAEEDRQLFLHARSFFSGNLPST